MQSPNIDLQRSMKGDRSSTQVDQEPNITNNFMFARLHHHHHHQLNRDQRQSTSEEEESRSSGGGDGSGLNLANKKSKTVLLADQANTSNGGGDGATIEVIRRPRGRPPGSKNKPKPQLLVTRDSTTDSSMRPVVLEIPGGVDVVDAISRFSRKRNIGLCVLTGSGTVTNVSLRQPSSSSTPGGSGGGVIVTFHGRFDILSISATFLPPSSSSPSSLQSAITNSFTISLAGPQGQIVGGSVAGALVAAGTVFVVAASFAAPSYHRLPMEEDASEMAISAASEERQHAPPSETCGMPIYSCHLGSSDAIWGSTSRPPF